MSSKLSSSSQGGPRFILQDKQLLRLKRFQKGLSKRKTVYWVAIKSAKIQNKKWELIRRTGGMQIKQLTCTLHIKSCTLLTIKFRTKAGNCKLEHYCKALKRMTDQHSDGTPDDFTIEKSLPI